jgi:hypothetical protein
MTRKASLICGIVSSLLYVATDVLGAARWDGYSYTSQSISELMAIGAPSRPLVVPLLLTYDILVIAFALGVWGAAGRKRSLRVVAGLLVGYGIVGLAGPFAPMHQRGMEATLTDTLHIMITMVLVLFILLAIGFGANAFGKRFRLYSIGTLLVLIGFGALTGLDGPRLAANLPTPWMGVYERINVFGFMLWVAALAVGLLRAEKWPMSTY